MIAHPDPRNLSTPARSRRRRRYVWAGSVVLGAAALWTTLTLISAAHRHSQPVIQTTAAPAPFHFSEKPLLMAQLRSAEAIAQQIGRAHV